MADQEAVAASSYCETVFHFLAECSHTSHWFRVAGKVVEIRFVEPYSPTVLNFYTKAINHLACIGQPADLVVWVGEKSHSGINLPRPFWDWQRLDQHGDILSFDVREYYASFDINLYAFTLFERAQSRAVVWIEDIARQPEWMRSFPFRKLWFEWLKTDGFLFLHAGAVGLRDGRGVLLTGRGGAGKSTSTLACLGSSLHYAGDDFVAIHPATRQVYSLYNVAKLEEHQFERFPHLKPLIYNADTIATEKGQVFTVDHFPEQLAICLRIEAVLLPRFTGNQHTRIYPATSSDSWWAAIPSTVSLLHPGNEYILALAQFIRQFPAYWLETGTELTEIPTQILSFLNGHSQQVAWKL